MYKKILSRSENNVINGNPKEFIDRLYYGDERFFKLNNRKYFIQGYYKNGKPLLALYVLEPSNDDFKWNATSKNESYPVPDFESAPIFAGKTFWQAEKEIEWLDD